MNRIAHPTLQSAVKNDYDYVFERDDRSKVPVINQLSVIGEFPMDDGYVAVDPTFTQYAVICGSPKCLKAFLEIENSREPKNLDMILDPRVSNTKRHLLSLCVYINNEAKAIECMNVILDFMKASGENYDVDFGGFNKRTALFEAVNQKKVGLVKFLLEKGANLLFSGGSVSCPLLLAARRCPSGDGAPADSAQAVWDEICSYLEKHYEEKVTIGSETKTYQEWIQSARVWNKNTCMFDPGSPDPCSFHEILSDSGCYKQAENVLEAAGGVKARIDAVAAVHSKDAPAARPGPQPTAKHTCETCGSEDAQEYNGHWYCDAHVRDS